MKYYPPEFEKSSFNCVHCNVFSEQDWDYFYWRPVGYSNIDKNIQLMFCSCFHCKKISYWYNGKMLVPSDSPVPPAHIDMPEECKIDYNEARDIVAISPRAACALLRLTLQKLMPILGEKGKNINEDIKLLVVKGLPALVQQALDYCRVVGNNAVHPGEIEINDTPEIAHNLFTMMNFIIEDRISKPKQIKELYDSLPECARIAIETRDNLEND